MINETKENDPKNLILYRAENTFIVLNRFPYNSGHLMILPNIHEGDLTRLNAEIQAEMMHLTSFAVNFLREEYKPHGFNLGINMGEIAGGSISPHLHIHVVPRWAGDTNFMPTIGETKVLPEDLGQTHARLSGRIRKISVPS
jgi:ATP adenylyltransferase